jgi:hypothetical protein
LLPSVTFPLTVAKVACDQAAVAMNANNMAASARQIGFILMD